MSLTHFSLHQFATLRERPIDQAQGSMKVSPSPSGVRLIGWDEPLAPVSGAEGNVC
jgi:hypothetical protein